MKPTSSYPNRRSFTIAAVAALAVVGFLGACQDNGPVAPSQGARFADSSAERDKGGNRQGSALVDWQLQDGVSPYNLLPGAHYHLSGPNNFSLDITDNVTPADQDPAVGKFMVKGLVGGAYTLCETVPPVKYLLPQPLAAHCFPFNLPAQSSVTFGAFYNFHIPQLDWTVVDVVGNWLYNATFQVFDSTNTAVTISDNDAKDLNFNLGRFLKEQAAAGVYKVCETVPPSGFMLPAQPCTSVYAGGGIEPVGDFVNRAPYSLSIHVTDTFNKPLAGTSFVVKRDGYPNLDINVTDNVAPDRDKKTGSYYVMVSGSGWYTVCQTNAPWGYDAPKLNGGCLSTFVSLGTPAGVGNFVDTPWPVAR